MSRFTQIAGARVRTSTAILSTILLSTVAGAQKTQTAPSSASGALGNVTIDLTPKNRLVFPYGVQSFERRERVTVGDSVQILPGWSIDSASVSAVVTENSSGISRPGTNSRRWLSVQDNGAALYEGMHSPFMQAPRPWNYSWKFAIQIETAPASAADAPVLAIQHVTSGGVQDAFGVRLTPTGAELFMTDAFGVAATAPLFTFGGLTDIGQWIDIRVDASLAKDTLTATVNGTEVAMLRILAPASTDLTRLRFSYHGSGAGNVASLLLDDVNVAFGSAVCEESALIDFETEDDDTTALVDGQDITTPPEFGEVMSVLGTGANNGAAIFDSTVGGPNDPSQDPDLLINQGNLLILQNDAAPASVGGIFPNPNDDEDGGQFAFGFVRWVQPITIDLVDIDGTPNEGVILVETDFSGLTRTFTVPPDWTGNGGVGTLDLQSLAAQPGFASIATAVEDPGFDPNAVVGMTIDMGGSGALDNLALIIPCVQLTFETEDDFNPDFSGTPLADGQDLSTPPEFGVEVAISSSGANAGAAIFDSTPGGPNDPGPDNDLLVGLGNILCLQSDNQASHTTQTVPGFFDSPNDDVNGGDVVFTFPGPVGCHFIDLIDVDEEEIAPAVVTLLDINGKTRVYTCPPSWTEDRLNDGPPAFRTLDLTTLAPQPGFAAVATATEDPGFDPEGVVQMTVTFGGAQDLDNFCFCP
jgi:hypothetical protein